MKVTIVGGGFAGVKAALELAKDPSVQVTVITDRPDFQYYPSLYSSATGHSHLESWVPLGEIFGGYENIHVHLDRVIGIDSEKKRLIGESEAIYDYHTLIIAVGVVTTYFGIPGLDQYSYGIKSAEEIRRLKQRIYNDLTNEKKLDKNYVVIGGGPTGIELAAALGTYLQRLCDYYGVKRRSTKIRLIEAAPRLLPRSHPKTSAKVKRRLEKLGVEVQLDTKVEKATATEIIASGRPIESHTVIWTSGVTNSPLFAAHPDIFRLAKNGRVEVDKHLKAHKDIYVLGDNAATQFTGLAQTALHDAKFIAENLLRHKRGIALKDYKAVQPASVVPVGARWATFEWHGIRMHGWPAAIIRRLADFIGYSDILPIGQALRPWHASMIYEHDYFYPEEKKTDK
jgi:NADH dehydrogenase